MQKSDTITALAGALAAAQSEIEGAKKDSTNPHFRSKYADLGAVWDACRGPLTKHGLAVVQFPRSENGCVLVETILTHKSGEWMSETLALPVSKQDAQGYGSAMTYARRYSLMAVAGIAPEDDDGNAAVLGGQGKQPEIITSEQAISLEDRIAKQGANKQALLEYYKVDGLHQLTPQQLASAHKSLDRHAAEARDASQSDHAEAA
jgi:ERF superfamily protein